MNAFVTGSRAYGEPREDSDIDLCILVDRFPQAFEEHYQQDGSGGGDGLSFRVGEINFLMFFPCEQHVFAAWKEATDELEQRRPVTRDEAIKVIDEKVKHAKERKKAETIKA